MGAILLSARLERALERLSSAKDDDEKWRVARDFFDQNGFPVVNYSFIDGTRGDLESAPVQMKSSADPDFIQHYLENRLDLVDPLADYGRSGRATPYVVGAALEETLANLPDDRRSHLDFVASASHSINLLVPLPAGPAGGALKSGLVLGARMKGVEFRTLMSERAPELLVFAHHMHISLQAGVRRELDGVEPLSVREVDCLQHIAAGKRPDRISEDMGLAVATVNFHLAKARTKLNARTTAEAVARAIRYAMIAP
ncbi:MAG: LuxR C-terminal-related transcriptional regulator [Oceanicaulis sp.]